jgi:tetratricopeptide (TPR) repeat protein
VSDQDRHLRLQEIFQAAADLNDSEREGFVGDACADDTSLRDEVLRLLDAADLTSDLLADDALAAGEQFTATNTSGELPAVFGGCKIIRQLGSGAMGVVWEAEQQEPKRRVAIKVLASGLPSSTLLRRFRGESDALALLRHPGIAQVYDSGVDFAMGRSTPYIIMELVEGKPLTEFAKQAKLGIQDRLTLAALVCDAVEHAHQRGVIHRDLKPSNILVDESGQPRVLDFGISHITDADIESTRVTEVGQLLGTIAYMSPEQAGGTPENVDTRSDVYGLGVVIYELLAGRLPHETSTVSLLEAVRTIQEESPDKLSRADTKFRGDIETIVAKAIQKEKNDRYQSAGELAEDIRRHLQNQPIVAHPPSAVYQAKKFVRRHKGLVTSMVLVLVSLVAGLIATSAALRRESVHRGVAEQALAHTESALTQAEVSASFLESMLLSVTPSEAAGRDTELMTMVLDRAAEEVDTELADQPLILARMHVVIGRAYGRLNEFATSVEHLEVAREIYAAHHEEAHPDRLNATYHLCATHRYAGENERGAALMDETLAVFERFGGDPHVHASHLTERASLAIELGEFTDALSYSERAVRMLGDDADHEIGIGSLMIRGNARRRAGQFEGALDDYNRVLVVLDRNPDDNHSLRVNLLTSFAVIRRQLGDLEEAELLFREAIQYRLELDSRTNRALAVLYMNLGRVLMSLERFEEAEKYVRISSQMHDELFGDTHFGTAIGIATLADILVKQKKHNESLVLYDQALIVFENTLGLDHPHIVTLLTSRCSALLSVNRFEDAAESMRRARAIVDAKDLGGDMYRSPVLYLLAKSEYGLGNEEAAQILLADSISALNEDSPEREILAAKFLEWTAAVTEYKP